MKFNLVKSLFKLFKTVKILFSDMTMAAVEDEILTSGRIKKSIQQAIKFNSNPEADQKII